MYRTSDYVVLGGYTSQGQQKVRGVTESQGSQRVLEVTWYEGRRYQSRAVLGNVGVPEDTMVFQGPRGY